MALGADVSLRKVTGHPRYKWRATFIEGARRRQRYFKTRRDAEDWAGERARESLDHGTAAALSPAERSAVIETRERLQAVGIDLRAALDHAIDYFERAKKSSDVETWIAEVIEARRRADRSDRHLRDLASKLGRFQKSFAGRSVATITRDEIAEWLHGLKLTGSSRNSYRRILVVAFNDAIESGYVAENPAAKVKQAKAIETEVGILTPRELAALLSAAGDEILPAIAIGAFAGVRAAELERMDWADVNLAQGFLRVRAAAAKSARNRLIPISPNLSDWLRPHARPGGKIWPPNGRKLHETARRGAGFGAPARLTAEELKSGKVLRPWPDNALRHSFASYHLAHHQDAAKLALEMGHADTGIIFRHYRELVTPSEAAAYWAVEPTPLKNLVAMASG